MAEEIVLSGPKTSLQEDLTRLYSQGFLTDITLSTEDGKNFEAHRILLAARSHYFHSVVPRLKTEAVIFLKGVKGAHLDKILKYIYSGSVSLSRHQLKPILEVAKSLQVKGLYDANPADILSRQGLTGPSPSAVQAIASRTGGNPAVIAAMQARAQQRSMVSPTSSADKTTATSFQRPLASSRANSKLKSPASYRSQDDDDSDSDEEVIVNKSKTESDIFDDEDNDDDDDDEEVITAKPAVTPRAETPPRATRRKRGRPPKNKKIEPVPSASAAESKGSDPYDFDADDNNDNASTSKMRSLGNDEKSKQTKQAKSSKEDQEEDNSSKSREVFEFQTCENATC
jgi:hypothetical protein